jgi:hypothetical protein
MLCYALLSMNIPVIYSQRYRINLMGLERLHPLALALPALLLDRGGYSKQAWRVQYDSIRRQLQAS